jgi:hypothetical protein
VPEGPSDTGALSFGSFLWANKENEQKKSIAGRTLILLPGPKDQILTDRIKFSKCASLE